MSEVVESCWSRQTNAPYGEFAVIKPGLVGSDRRLSLLKDAEQIASLFADLQVKAWKAPEGDKNADALGADALTVAQAIQSRFNRNLGHDDIWLIKNIARSAFTPVSYYYAEGYSSDLPGVSVLGCIKVKKDVSGNPATKLLKRIMYPQRVYAAILDVAVNPSAQHKGVGAALVHTALKNFNPSLLTTSYAYSTSTQSQETLKRFKFEATGAHKRADLFGPDSNIEEIRFLGPSVEALQYALEEKYNWLAKSEDTVA